jgi:hypothetical protein
MASRIFVPHEFGKIMASASRGRLPLPSAAFLSPRESDIAYGQKIEIVEKTVN